MRNDGKFRIDPETVAAEGLPARLGELIFDMPDRLSFRQIELIERLSRTSSDEWSSRMWGRAAAWFGVRATDPKLLTWQQSADLSTKDIIDVDDDEPEDDELGDVQDDTEAAAQHEAAIEAQLKAEDADPTTPAAS